MIWSGKGRTVEGGILTIVLPNRTTKTIQLPEGADAPPLGQLVTVFARSRVAAGGDDPPVMTGLRTAEQIQTRLETFLGELAGSGSELPAEMLQDRARLTAEIADRLEEHSRLRAQVLEQVCDRVCQNEELPLQARERITAALENAQRLQTEAMTRAEEARAKAGPPETSSGTPERPNGQQPGSQEQSKGKPQGDGRGGGDY